MFQREFGMVRRGGVTERKLPLRKRTENNSLILDRKFEGNGAFQG
jgi:hypothetical protein